MKESKKTNEPRLAIRSCWNCNPAHEHLKKSDGIIFCPLCFETYYKGEKLDFNIQDKDKATKEKAMKRYKLKYDLPTFKSGSTFYINELGSLCAEDTQGMRELVAYTAKTMEKFPEILGEWFVKIPNGYNRWRADNNGGYYYCDGYGGIQHATEEYDITDTHRFKIGNYFKTREEGEAVLAKLEAYQTIKDDTKGFEPNWDDEDQLKFLVLSDYTVGYEADVPLRSVGESLKVFFATRKEAEDSIKTHRKEWEILLGSGEH